MKTKLLIIIGIVAIIAVSIAMAYEMSTIKYSYICDGRYEKIDGKCELRPAYVQWSDSPVTKEDGCYTVYISNSRVVTCE